MKNVLGERENANSPLYAAVAGHLIAEVAGEVVLLHKDNGQYFGLNHVGKRIWDMLQNEVCQSEIVATIVSEFDAEQMAIQNDVECLIVELLEAGLVRRLA